MKKNHSKVFWAIVLIAVILLIRSVFFKNNKEVYTTATVTRGDLVETLTTTGKIKADEFANLTFQSGGRLAFVNFKKGDTVKKGQAIAGLDTVILNASYQQALNNYKKYEASAQSTLDSLKGHAGDETYAQKSTRTDAEVARDNAYDSVKIALENLRYATIYAPFTGILTDAVPSFAGVNVSPSNSSYILVNPNTVYFDSEISEVDLPKVKLGQKVEISLDAYPDSSVEGEIENIGIVAYTSSTGGNAYSLRINLLASPVGGPKNLDQKFKIGMGGDAKIILATNENVLKIPSTAIIFENDKNYVLVEVNGKLTKKEVKVGAISDTETQILEGLNEGEKVKI